MPSIYKCNKNRFKERNEEKMKNYKKVGEHVTIDFLGVKRITLPIFTAKLYIKLQKKLK